MSFDTKVGIIMGSDSDLQIMQESAKILAEFDIACDMHTLSAHRTPDAVVSYVQNFEQNGGIVFICGAGGAAHLAGVVASHTALPVIGVPIMNNATSGVDALFSTVQMPPGIPVATVAINGAKNAGILAMQIIGANDPAERAKIIEYKSNMSKDIISKDAKLQEKGFKKYLEEMNLI